MDEKLVKKTQDSLGKIITRPPLTPKLLSKPPFRFLHDIISEVIKTTSFMKGLYGQGESDSKKLVNREEKMAFLQKAIDVVSIVSGTNILIKTSKVVAGAEPEKTNEFLQLLARCIRKNKSSEDAVHQVLSGKKSQQDSIKLKVSNDKVKNDKKSSESKKEKIKDEEKSKRREHKVREEKIQKVQDRSIEDKDQKRKIEKEKKRRERSENYIKDEVQSTEQSEKRDHKHRKERKEKNHNKNEKNKQADDKENLRDTENENKSFKREEINEKKKSKEEKHKSKEKERSKRHDKNKDKNKTSDEKDKEREKRRQERKKRKELEAKQKAENLETDKTNEKTVEKVQENTEVSSVPPRILRPASAKGQRRRPHTRNGRDNIQPEASTELTSEQVIVNSRKIVRPPSARPSAPRVRNIQQVADEKNNKSFQDKEATIIVDRDQTMTLSDDEDAEFVVQEDEVTAIENDILQPSLITEDQSVLNSEEHGGLVRKILETKNELEGKYIEKQPHTHIHQSSVLNAQKKKEQELVVKEIDQLREMVQKLCQTSAPLAKLIDYSQEDMDAMTNELNIWKKENLQHNIQIKEDNSVTAASIEPLKVELEELDQAIADYRLKMATTKVNILKNDEKIQKMAIAVATRS